MSSKLLYYRITYKGEGIYNAIKKNIDKNVWVQLLSSKQINWLPKPPNYTCDCRSYFTQRGYDMFNKKVLPLIRDYLDSDKINVEEVFNLENIIYSDVYQVVVTEKSRL